MAINPVTGQEDYYDQTNQAAGTQALPPPPGDELTGGGQCPPGQTYNPSWGGCETAEQTGGGYDQTGQCPEGQVPNPQSATGCSHPDQIPDLPCPEGWNFHSLSGLCVPGEGGGNSPYDPVRPGDEPGTTYPDGGYQGDPTAPPGGGVDTNPQDGYNTALPPVDPYDVSNSRDWMNIFDYGGENANVNAINPQAQDFAYDQVGEFSDAAWQESMRYLEPQMDLQNDRFAQELINKGMDPNSEAGQKAFRQKQMGQNDLMSKSAFDALGYGSGLQNQMFGQDATRSQLANAMLQSQMGLSQRGHEFDTSAGMQANDQAFGQMMGMEGLNYRDYLSYVDQSRYQDSLSLALAGLAPAPTFQTMNAGLPQAPVYEYGQGQNYMNNLYGSQ